MIVKTDTKSNFLASDREILIPLGRLIFGPIPTIDPIAASGSSRRYYRLSDEKKTVIGTVGTNPQENEAFIALSKHFASKDLPVPKVLAISPDRMAYIQEDVGRVSLFEAIERGRTTGHFDEKETELLENTVKMLAQVQTQGAAELDFSVCYPSEAFNGRMVDWDLNYFKYCFLKPLGLELDEEALQDDFDRLKHQLLPNGECQDMTFMVRDFQSRNVMIDNKGTLHLIDFQGGRRGPAEYDVASLLWQAKAHIPEDLRTRLINVYMEERKRLNPLFDEGVFLKRLPLFMLLRTLQVLGAYGFRGLIQGKRHFLESIPPGVENLKATATGEFPALRRIAGRLAPPALKVTVGSFSYKAGLPEDHSGNGGGFVFDCRATHNPGRYTPFKQLTGRDKQVIEFLEEDGEILPFLRNAEEMADASVERYLQRGFTALSIWFGCTGGQHRSVYCAEHLARHLNNKYGVTVELIHREQDIKEQLQGCLLPLQFDSYLKNPQKQWKEK